MLRDWAVDVLWNRDVKMCLENSVLSVFVVHC